VSRLADNAFYVLGLGVDCTRAELERQGQKLLAQLELELHAAAEYTTPVGCFARTPEKVREAMAELRDPDHRARHALWARLTAQPVVELQDPADLASPWVGALRKLGWRSS
jgi:hypothetical protein